MGPKESLIRICLLSVIFNFLFCIAHAQILEVNIPAKQGPLSDADKQALIEVLKKNGIDLSVDPKAEMVRGKEGITISKASIKDGKGVEISGTGITIKEDGTLVSAAKADYSSPSKSVTALGLENAKFTDGTLSSADKIKKLNLEHNVLVVGGKLVSQQKIEATGVIGYEQTKPASNPQELMAAKNILGATFKADTLKTPWVGAPGQKPDSKVDLRPSTGTKIEVLADGKINNVASVQMPTGQKVIMDKGSVAFKADLFGFTSFSSEKITVLNPDGKPSVEVTMGKDEKGNPNPLWLSSLNGEKADYAVKKPDLIKFEGKTIEKPQTYIAINSFASTKPLSAQEKADQLAKDPKFQQMLGTDEAGARESLRKKFEDPKSPLKSATGMDISVISNSDGSVHFVEGGTSGRSQVPAPEKPPALPGSFEPPSSPPGAVDPIEAPIQPVVLGANQPSSSQFGFQGGTQLNGPGLTDAIRETIAVIFQQARNFFLSSGSQFFGSANSIVFRLNGSNRSLVIENGLDIELRDGLLFVRKADLFLRDRSSVTNLENLVSGSTLFFVGKAETVFSECAKFANIKNSTFRITEDTVEITSTADVTFNITDCIFNNALFESANGSLYLAKTAPPTYIIEKGTLIVAQENYTETIETKSRAEIEFSLQFGMACARMHADSTYWYTDHNALQRDFGVHVPKNASPFKLCLRKDQNQNFSRYDGMINFVQHYAHFSRDISYLKYPLRDGKVSSLLMQPLVFILEDFNVTMHLDSSFSFVERIEIKQDPLSKKEQVRTDPNDYFIIRESSVNDDIHRLIRIDTNVRMPSQPRFKIYRTDYFTPILFRDGNTLVQREGLSNIRLLPFSHEDIARILS